MFSEYLLTLYHKEGQILLSTSTKMLFSVASELLCSSRPETRAGLSTKEIKWSELFIKQWKWTKGYAIKKTQRYRKSAALAAGEGRGMDRIPNNSYHYPKKCLYIFENVQCSRIFRLRSFSSLCWHSGLALSFQHLKNISKWWILKISYIIQLLSSRMNSCPYLK